MNGKSQTAMRSKPPDKLAAVSVLQRKCACGNHTVAGGECSECSKSGKTLQRATANPESETQNSGGVPPIVNEVLRSPGQPLDGDTRAFMEPRFGQNFSHVRVHAGSLAAESARSVNALAYTVGSKIVFGSGQYSPTTGAGQQLLAHELTHVLQQRDTVNVKDVEGTPGDVHEQQANAVAENVLAVQPSMAVKVQPQTALAAPAIQRQKKPDATARAPVGPKPKKDMDALITQLKARLILLTNQNNYLKSAYAVEKMGQLQAIPSAGQHVHQALAYAFIKHNPDARIKSVSNAAVSIDTSEIPKWKEKEPLEEYSHGTYLATKFPSYAKFFITGPGTLWITLAGVKAYPDEYREFLWRSGRVPEAELAEIMDPWFKQAGHAISQHIKSFDRETPQEAPLLVQFIADLNPLMAVAKLISLLKDNKSLYAMPGTKATTLDWVEAYVGLAAMGESILGDLVKVSIKGAQSAKMINVAEKMLSPFGEVIDEAVKTWSKDEVVQQILAELIKAALDKALEKGVLNPALEESLKTKPKGKQALGPGQR